jgi:microcystin-dependent protein
VLAAPNGEDANLGAVTVKMYAPSDANNKQLAPQSIGIAGGSQPFSILQPLLCVNYSIALEGIFPSRN